MIKIKVVVSKVEKEFGKISKPENQIYREVMKRTEIQISIGLSVLIVFCQGLISYLGF